MKISELQKCIRAGKYEISLHAQNERCHEEINIQDVERAILQGEIIEDYPEDQRGHSCLILGYSKNKPVHIVCSMLSNKWARVITVYIPKIPKWINPRQRRK